MEYINAPISSSNYSEFLFFIFRLLDKYWNEKTSFSAMKLLSITIGLVQADHNISFFLSLHLIPIIRKYFILSHIRQQCFGIVSEFLSGFVKLQIRISTEIYNAGIVSELIRGVLDRSLDVIARSKALECIVHICEKNPPIKRIILDFINLNTLIYDIGFEHLPLFISGVDMFMAAIVPPRSPSTPLTIQYIQTALDKSIELFKSSNSEELVAGCRVVRRLSRCINILDDYVVDFASKGRSILLDLLDNIRDIPINELDIIDTLAALCGWKRLYWRTQASRELKDILQCLEEIRSNGLTDTMSVSDEVDDADSDSAHAKGKRSSLYAYSTSPINADRDADQRISGESLAYTSKRLLSNAPFLHNFLSEWKSMSYFTVIRKIAFMSAISHSLGMDSLESLINIREVCDALVELLLDNQHDVEDYSSMQERCMQLIIDITLYDPVALQCKLAVCEAAVDIMSVWKNLNNTSLMLTCITLLIILSHCDKSGKSGQFVALSFRKVGDVAMFLGDPVGLSPLLFLLRELVPCLEDFDLDGVVVMVGLIVRGLQCELGRTRLRACQVITDAAAANNNFFYNYLCRREIEEALIFALDISTEPTHAIEAVKACTACLRHFNPNPVWSMEADFVLHWSITRRYIIGAEVGTVMIKTMKKYSGPTKVLVLAFCMDFAAAVFKSCTDRTSELHKLLLDQIIDDIPNTLFMLNGEADLESDCGTLNSGNGGISELPEAKSMAYELLSFHVLQLIQVFICHDMTECMRRLHLYSDTPVCHAVPRIMTRFPRNQLIQRFGIDILRIFAVKKVDLPRLCEYAPTALMIAIEACPHDAELLRAFCTLVDVLARCGAESVKDSLLKVGIHKALCGILRSCSRELTPFALIAVANICTNADRANAIGEIGMPSVVKRVMDRHCDVLRVQVEGLRTFIALDLDPEAATRLNAIDGRMTIRRVRQMLSHVQRQNALGGEYDPLEIHELLKQSNGLEVSNTSCSCTIS